jgi:hypothetical protein
VCITSLHKNEATETKWCPFLEIAKEENKSYSKFPSVHDSLLKKSNSSASSGIPENQQNESVVSENLNDESAVPQDQENESSMLQSDHSITVEDHDDVE